MRVLIVYKDKSDHAREVIDYMADFQRTTGQLLETLDPDTPSGMDFCRVYDIVEYPTIIALTDTGVMQNMWRGRPLPLISEVSYYVAQSV